MGSTLPPDLTELEFHRENLDSRDWGKLPGHLRTEILEAELKKPNSDYARLIKLYFEEISKMEDRKRTSKR